jgi:hypothetical protein
MLPQRHPQLGAHFGGVGGVTPPTRRVAYFFAIGNQIFFRKHPSTRSPPGLVSGFNLISSETGGRATFLI